MRLRSLMFKAILNQEMGWFDEKDNGVGALCARLSGEAASVQGATGQRIGSMLNSTTTIIIAITVSFYYEWRLAFVALCFAPLIVLSIYLEQRIMAKESQGNYESLQKSTKVRKQNLLIFSTRWILDCSGSHQRNSNGRIVGMRASFSRSVHERVISLPEDGQTEYSLQGVSVWVLQKFDVLLLCSCVVLRSHVGKRRRNRLRPSVHVRSNDFLSSFAFEIFFQCIRELDYRFLVVGQRSGLHSELLQGFDCG